MIQSEQLKVALKDLADAFARQSMGAFFRVAKEKELSPSQLGALMRIGRGGRRGIMRIGGDMSMTGAAASQMIDRLVQQGLVERREDPEDRRSKQISLTTLGERMVKECGESRKRWLSELAAGMSAEEAELMIDSLRMLTTKMKELDAASPDAFGWVE